MPNGGIHTSEQPPDFKSQGEQFGLGVTDPVVLNRTGKWLVSAFGNLLQIGFEFILKNAGRLVVFLAKRIAAGEDRADPVFRELTDAAIQDLTGAPAGSGHGAVGKQLMNALTGGTAGAAPGELRPSTAGAEAFMESVMKLALEGYLEGSLFHALSLGYMEKFGELDDILANVLGVGRASRAVMRPILNARVITPTTWHVNRAYRPQLLSTSELARQIARGRGDREKWLEQLRWQGYDEQSIEAILNAQAKFHSVADVDLLWRTGEWTRDQAVQHLRDQGYEQTVADMELRLERLRQIATFERRMADAAVTAFVNRRIGESELRQWVNGATIDGKEQAQIVELAHARRALNVKDLSPAEARACVKAGILSVRDYRLALERDGYTDDAVTALELLLRHELDEQARIEDLRERQAEERDAEQQRRANERARKAAEAEAELALQRRGRAGDLQRAVVRGLIPVSRLVEVLSARYDPDTVDILVESVELDRLQYLEQQQQRDEAAKRAERRELSVGDLERAVLANELPLVDYRRRLELAGLTPEDADLLTRTLSARLDDLTESRRKRDEAELAARHRAIDLGRFEQLVRRGARSVAQYDALLRDLGFGDGARAGMIDLLQLKIADDTEARRQREEAEARLRTKGLSLEQFRRGVVLGVKTPQQFEQFLIEQGFTADAQSVLMADLQQAIEDAEAARRRREAADARPDARAIPLSTVARAARLGVVSPTVYQARLQREGFTEEDIAIEMELLLLEIADTQAARRREQEAEAAADARGVSLSTLARAVRLGVRTLEDYRAAAIQAGLPSEEVDLLVQILGAEVRQLIDARARREQIDAELRPRNLSVAQLEEAVTKQFRSIEDFMADVMALGYSPEDAQLLAALLLHDLETKAAG